jgi:hypothetical protein
MITYVKCGNRSSDLLKLVWLEGRDILLINIVIYISGFSLFIENIYAIEWFLLFMFIILLFRKRNRIINKIVFDDDKQSLQLEYHNPLRSFTVDIPYYLLDYSLRDKMYDLLISKKTLEIFSGTSYIAEIRIKSSFGWKKDDIRDIIEKLTIIKNEGNNKIPLKRESYSK